MMNKISSDWTFFYKKLFPAIWLGALGFATLILFFSGTISRGPGYIVLLFPLLIAASGYLMMRNFILDLVDEVVDNDSTLLIKNGEKKLQVNLADIKEIKSGHL